MAVAIRIPDIGTTVDTVLLVEWIKSEGDPVKRGDPLCELQTDKSTLELESIAAGVLLKQVVPGQSEVEKDTIVAYVGKEGEILDELDAEPAESSNAVTEATNEVKSKLDADHPRVPILIRNIARRRGVDLATVTGTGPNGIITKHDVYSAEKAPVPTPASAPEPPLTSHLSPLTGLSKNQGIVARRVVESQQTIPPIHMFFDVRMTRVIEKREALKQAGTKVSYDALFASKLAELMLEFPHFRSTFNNGAATTTDQANIGIAVSAGDELFIPVVHDAATRSVEQVNAQIQAYAGKAIRNSFTMDELSGATLSISNLGMYPVRAFTAVIPPDQTAILAIGAIRDVPIVHDGGIRIEPVSEIVLSVDHRMINGREAAEFAAALKQAMEEFE